MYQLTANRKAILDTINWAEGSPGYDQLFAYVPFNNNGPHPHQYVTASGYTSDAAGAYQFLYTTWQETITFAGLPDYMSAENQDQVALARIDWRGALGDVDNGNIDAAIDKLNEEWASFPGSPYGQPTRDLDEFTNYYQSRVDFYSGPAGSLFSFLGISGRAVPSNWPLITVVVLAGLLAIIIVYINLNKSK